MSDLDIARNIVNQIADCYAELIPSPEWIRVRQETNDHLDEFVVKLLSEHVWGVER